MNWEDLKDAENEAQRFLSRTKRLKENWSDSINIGIGTKESGAVRRASLDLTRSLARLRNGN